jgi:DNA-binding MarR family transcriptional regulator
MSDHEDVQRRRLTLLFRLLHQHYARDVDAMLRNAGFADISPGHAKVFPFVPPEGISVGELAASAGVRKQTMAEAVEQLERAGYLQRRPNPLDRRSRLIFLTDRGRAVQPVASSAGQLVEEQWARLTSPQELEDLRQRLEYLIERIAKRDADDGRPG